MTANAPEAVPTLAYGRSPRSYRWAKRLAKFGLPALVVAAAAWWAVPRVPVQLRILGQQSALLRQARPATTAVWDETEAKVAAIQAAGNPSAGGYALRVIGGQPVVTTAACLYDAPRREFDAAAGLSPLDFTAFAHARTGTNGKTRLVIVMGFGGRPMSTPITGRMMLMTCAVIEPGTFFRPPKTISKSASPLSIQLDPDDRFRLYAGQVDSADPSRFTIDYDCNGVGGRLEGVLGPDDAVTLTPTGDRIIDIDFKGPVILPAGSKARRPTTSPARH